MREIPHSPVALYKAANLFGTLIAETILASVHVRARKQAGHMDASDLINAAAKHLARRRPSTYGESGLNPPVLTVSYPDFLFIRYVESVLPFQLSGVYPNEIRADLECRQCYGADWNELIYRFTTAVRAIGCQPE